MSGSLIINGMMTFFSVTTVAVLAFPLYRLAPSWLEGRVHRQIAWHRAALAALATEMPRAHNDPDQHARLAAQHEWHRRALAALAPDANTPATEGARDAA